MKSVLIIYGSTGGNTQMVVEAVAMHLKQAGVDIVLQRAEKSQPEDIQKADVVILASPTYGHGILERYMEEYVRSIKGVDLGQRPMAVIGVGEPKYELQYHIESANILEAVIKEQNGAILLPALKISGTPIRHLEGFIPNWSKKLIELL